MEQPKLVSQPSEKKLLLLVIYCGALGASIRALSSFLYFAGNDKLKSDWVPWYLGLPIIGLGLAVAIYFAFRAGFVGLGNASLGAINVFGISAISAVVGLFSTQAMEKLKQIAESIFVQSSQHAGALGSGKPKIIEIKPKAISATQGGTVVIFGTGFTDKTKVYVDGHQVAHTKRSDTAFEFPVESAWLSAGVAVDVYARNPPPDDGISAKVELQVQ